MKLSTIMIATLSLTAAMNASALTQGTAKLISHHVTSTNPALVLTLADVAKSGKELGLSTLKQQAINKTMGLPENGDDALVDVMIDRELTAKVNEPTEIIGFTKIYIQNMTDVTHQYTLSTVYCSLKLHAACTSVKDVYELQPQTFFEITKKADINSTYNTAGFDQAIFSVGVQRDNSSQYFIAESTQDINVEA